MATNFPTNPNNGDTYTNSSDLSGIIEIGGYGGSQTWNGYMEDVRITQGLARYTENFTPPTAALQG